MTRSLTLSDLDAPTLPAVREDTVHLLAVVGRHLLNVGELDAPPPGLARALAEAWDALAIAHNLSNTPSK